MFLIEKKWSDLEQDSDPDPFRGVTDPDPYQNETDPKHFKFLYWPIKDSLGKDLPGLWVDLEVVFALVPKEPSMKDMPRHL